ncbi:GDP-mannose 4,6-dehydratase [Solidesulfovibrio magneticus]|uniref:GDP-mannose 4,6-dehydratase n=1 Tax=Solidesulfovibrio magneticus (strain ATCC 700980 / DSM 13731 / RS-1) TaxID=573370 RepID=C4XUF4_SOLM1|nr:GDP-mannose 4,6-dehydratase [Solidesulfovibrio magneticus]BAH76171.1 GDP-mannose 4,6-dehydratase [Solidesulfovibrio magneticus RS-1]
MKQALIFGVSGQDGAYLAQLLLQKGYRVAGTSRDAQMASLASLSALGIREQVEVHSVTLTDFRSVLTVLAKVKPDEIYHLAGQSSVGLSFDQPVETFMSIGVGTLNLLEAVRFLGAPARLYHASSSDCFGDTGGEPATELTPFSPRSPYAVAKAAAHFEVANYREAYKLFACNGILFNHESPLRPKRFVTRKIVAAAARIAAGSGETLLLGNIDVARDWGNAREYVEAMWLMLQQDVPEDFVIATGQTITLRQFVAEAFAALGLDWQDHVQVDSTLFRPADIAVSRANPAKAAQALGWKATMGPADVARAMAVHEQQEILQK